MAKIFSYTVMLAVLVAVLYFGINYSSPFAESFNLASPSTWGNSTFFTTLMTVIISAAIFGAFATFIGRSPSESYILGIGTLFGTGAIGGGLLTLFVTEVGGILSFMYNNYPEMTWLNNGLSIIFFGLITGYVIALVQFWRGNDI